METAQLIDALSRPVTYPYAVAEVVVKQTHISAVFLAGPYVYKVKKPVSLGFLDFSTLEKRKYDCEQEVRLNRRMAGDVYLGVVPVVAGPGGLRFEAEGEPVEWAVKMKHLPDDATLEALLAAGRIGEPEVRRLAARLAEFHAAAEGNGHIAGFGRFEVIAANACENFTQTTRQVGVTVDAGVHGRLRELTEEHLGRLRGLMEQRAKAGRTKDTHGDLRLEHVYLFPDHPPPGDVVVIDCIEFNDRFRYADPVSDAAFLAMDLLFQGHTRLARVFTTAYLEAAQDPGGERLMPFYVAYRAAVRAKVEGMKAVESEVPAPARETAAREATAHWLLALAELESPARRPCLLLVGGLPGAGKSTLARALAVEAGFQVIRTDAVRKELAGVRGESTAGPFGAGLYSPEWDQHTYAECLRRADAQLLAGGRVLVDASFRGEANRRLFLDRARLRGVPGYFLHCRASPETARRRIGGRAGDVSDADWDIHVRARDAWEPLSPATASAAFDVSTEGPPDGVAAQTLQILQAAGLAEPAGPGPTA